MDSDMNQDFDANAFRRELESVATGTDGVPFGGIQHYWNAEIVHKETVKANSGGMLFIVRVFQCFFLETVGYVNQFSMQGRTCPQLPFYKRNLVPKLVHVFQQICASDLLATHGYPLPAYAMLRNTFDELVLMSAAFQGMTDFIKLEGSIPGKTPLDKESKELRRKTERDVRQKMTGANSGMSASTIENLRLWDQMFDFEVHGARLSHGTAGGWIEGSDPVLPVIPQYRLDTVALYGNRVCEVAWMAHRLLPLFQHSAFTFPKEWAEKWCILDRRFKDQVQFYARQQKKAVGLAIIELVEKKFPFSEVSRYPLEGSGVGGE